LNLRWTRLLEITGGDGRIPGMEGLRGLAILLVFATHCWVFFGERWVAPGTAAFAVGNALYLVGNTGVDLFFALSGYLVYGGLMGRPVRIGVYARHRIRRIYPAYLVVFAIYLAGALADPASGKLPAHAGPAAAYLAACLLMLPGIVQMPPLVSVAWSLSYEFAFYVIVPIAVCGLRMRERDRRIRIAVILGLAGIALGFAWLTGLHARMAMFAAGMMLWEARPAGGPSGLRDTAAVLGTCAAGVAAVILRGSWGPTGTAYPADVLQAAILAVGYFLLVRAALEDGLVGRGLSWRPMRWLGNISFSFYLVHTLALRVWSGIFSHVPSMLLDRGLALLFAIPLGFVLALTFSLALYLLVERPFSLARPARRAAAGNSGGKAAPVSAS